MEGKGEIAIGSEVWWANKRGGHGQTGTFGEEVPTIQKLEKKKLDKD